MFRRISNSWSLVKASAAVLQIIEQRAAILGRIVAAVLGLMWNLATFLAVPVLVAEKLGPIATVKRSVQLLKKTWGESIVGDAAIGTVFGLMMFSTIVFS